jgi:lysophospholipase L1-like esterase
VLFSLVANGFLIVAVVLLFFQNHNFLAGWNAKASGVPPESAPGDSATLSHLGTRYQLNYADWLRLLAQEAKVVAEKHPAHLAVLAGDSLSLWFPNDLLPSDQVWLNQGISGETSGGLLKRLNLFDQTQPEIIFVMIGINDLIRGLPDETVIENQREIIHYLRQMHPNSQIVVQSILPHAGAAATWQGRDRLQNLPNDRIRALNRELAAIATREQVTYLDLHPLFTNPQGDLRPKLSTDGLHLSEDGYLVWRSALLLYSQAGLARNGK